MRSASTAEVTVPKIKVEDGKFLFSTNGTDWVVIGDAGTSGIGLIKNVREDVENNSVIIELSDREIVIPKGQNFALVIKADEIGIKAGETVNVEYSFRFLQLRGNFQSLRHLLWWTHLF